MKKREISWTHYWKNALALATSQFSEEQFHLQAIGPKFYGLWQWIYLHITTWSGRRARNINKKGLQKMIYCQLSELHLTETGKWQMLTNAITSSTFITIRPLNLPCGHFRQLAFLFRNLHPSSGCCYWWLDNECLWKLGPGGPIRLLVWYISRRDLFIV